MKSVSHSLTMLVCGLLLVGCFKANARLLEVQERSVITFSSPVAQDYHLSTPDRHYIIRAPHRQFSVHLRDYLGPVDITVHNNAAPTPSENDISIHSEEKPAAMEFATLLGEYLVGEETSSTIAPGNRPATLAELAELAELATSSRADEIPDHQLITLLALCNQQRNFGCADLIARQLHSRSALGLQDYASTLLLYARVQHRQDRQDERIRLLEQLLQKIGGSQHLKHEYLTARSELCDALIFQGRNESLRCLQTLLPETTAFPDIHAMVLNNLGGYYTAVERQSDLAASYFLQAEQVYQSLNQPYGEALALYNRGTILKDNRQYQESVKALTSAYHLFREGDHLTEYARTTAALGGIYLALERYPLANQFLTEALNKLSGNTENRLSAAVKMMLGSISREAGDTEEAVAYHTDYVRYHREIIRSDSPWRVARGLLELAKDQSALGEPDQALTLLEEGELILESDHSPLHASILAERAGALLSKNLPEEAEASALAALEIFQREDHVMPEELRVWGKLQEIYIRQQAPQKALTTGQLRLDRLASLLSEAGPSETTGFLHASLQSSWADQVHLLSHFSTQPDALIQAQDLLFASRSFVVSATTDSAINSLQRLRLDALERGATDEATHLQLAIERHRAELGVSRNNQATLLSTAEIQAGLLADEVVLSLNRSHFGTTLFLLRPDSLQTVSLPDAESIEADVAILLRSASERGRFDYPSATRLGQLFLGPVLAHRQVRKIYWFPDELTNNIPFAALNIGTAERYQPAITRFTTSLIPAFRHNLLTMPEPDSIAVLSAALPDAWEPASGADEIRTWSATAQPLLWAGREVAEIVRLFNTRKPLVFTNQQASIEALQALKNTDIIHIASHGYVSQQDQDLAGLVLYGDGGEPQFVGWRSFSALNLNSRLVFLNGCQTARGEAIQGNGVYGLARGFLESGAHNVLATRWNISDRSAFRLTQAFYQQLKSGQGISESLRQAQATLYSSPQFRDPYYWASYALYSQKKSL